jgi:tetratricopeptide (TPR) repeat protein
MKRRAYALSLAIVALASASSLGAPRARAEDASEESEEEPEKTPAQIEAEKHYKRAKELYSLGRYREAIAQLEAALKLDPKGAELLYNLGLVHEKLGDADEAIDAYQRYLKVLGDDVDPEEDKKIRGIIKRLEGAKAELAAKEAKKTEHRFTSVSTGLAVGSAVAVGFTLFFGVNALNHDKKARDFMVGSDGTAADRDALIDKSKREAIFADVFGVAAIGAGVASAILYFTSEFPKTDNPEDSKPPPPVTSFMVTPIAMGGAAMRFEVAF